MVRSMVFQFWVIRIPRPRRDDVLEGFRAAVPHEVNGGAVLAAGRLRSTPFSTQTRAPSGMPPGP